MEFLITPHPGKLDKNFENRILAILGKKLRVWVRNLRKKRFSVVFLVAASSLFYVYVLHRCVGGGCGRRGIKFTV